MENSNEESQLLDDREYRASSIPVVYTNNSSPDTTANQPSHEGLSNLSDVASNDLELGTGSQNDGSPSHDALGMENDPTFDMHSLTVSTEPKRESVPDEIPVVLLPWSLYLGLSYTLLIGVGASIVFPTLYSYNIALNASDFIIGASFGITGPVAFIAQLVGYYWVHRSYKWPLVTSSLFMLAGYIFYAFAWIAKSLFMLLFSRILTSFDMANLGRYISYNVPEDRRPFFMSLRFAFLELGLAVGYLLAAFLYYIPDLKLGPFLFDSYNNPGWLNIPLWTALFVLILTLFKDPWYLINKAAREKRRRAKYTKEMRPCTRSLLQCKGVVSRCFSKIFHPCKKAVVDNERLPSSKKEKISPPVEPFHHTNNDGLSQNISPEEPASPVREQQRRRTALLSEEDMRNFRVNMFTETATTFLEAESLSTARFVYILLLQCRVLLDGVVMGGAEVYFLFLLTSTFNFKPDITGYISAGVIVTGVGMALLLNQLFTRCKVNENRVVFSGMLAAVCGLLIMYRYVPSKYSVAQAVVGNVIYLFGSTLFRGPQLSVANQACPMWAKYGRMKLKRTFVIQLASYMLMIGRGIGAFLASQNNFLPVPVVDSVLLACQGAMTLIYFYYAKVERY